MSRVWDSEYITTLKTVTVNFIPLTLSYYSYSDALELLELLNE